MFSIATFAESELPVWFLEVSSILVPVTASSRALWEFNSGFLRAVSLALLIYLSLSLSLFTPLVIFSRGLLLVSGRMEMRSGQSGV